MLHNIFYFVFILLGLEQDELIIQQHREIEKEVVKLLFYKMYSTYYIVIIDEI